jgi:hypothetical protein
MLRWKAYADLRFRESAHLALARAVEESASEAFTSLPDAWLVEDRKITLHAVAETPLAEMLALKQLVIALLRAADHGEAVIEVPPFERWIGRAPVGALHAAPGSSPSAGGPRDVGQSVPRASSAPFPFAEEPPDSEDRTTLPLALGYGRDHDELEPDIRR